MEAEAKKQVPGNPPAKEGNTKPYDFGTLINRNVENMTAHHELVKTHAAQSLKIAITISVLGFVLIFTGLIMRYAQPDYVIGYITLVTGLIVECIAAMLFSQYNKTVLQLKEYHDSLTDVQNVLLSCKLIESTTDEKSRSDMITKMIEFLVIKKVRPTIHTGVV